MAFGTWMVWIFSYFLSWRDTAYLAMIPSILLTLVMIPLPETPYWLIEADRKDLAEYVTKTQCGNFKIFVSLGFCVKSILRILDVQSLPFLSF